MEPNNVTIASKIKVTSLDKVNPFTNDFSAVIQDSISSVYATDPVFDKLAPMSFTKEKATWEAIAKSEILGPFASKSGWIWSQEQKQVLRPTTAQTSQKPEINRIKKILGKALVTRFVKKGIISTESERKSKGMLKGEERTTTSFAIKRKAFDKAHLSIKKFVSNLSGMRLKGSQKRRHSGIEFIFTPLLDPDTDFEKFPRCKTSLLPSKSGKARYYKNPSPKGNAMKSTNITQRPVHVIRSSTVKVEESPKQESVAKSPKAALDQITQTIRRRITGLIRKKPGMAEVSRSNLCKYNSSAAKLSKQKPLPALPKKCKKGGGAVNLLIPSQSMHNIFVKSSPKVGPRVSVNANFYYFRPNKTIEHYVVNHRPQIMPKCMSMPKIIPKIKPMVVKPIPSPFSLSTQVSGRKEIVKGMKSAKVKKSSKMTCAPKYKTSTSIAAAKGIYYTSRISFNA